MRWKWVLVAAILTVAALILTIWVIIANYDYNKLKPGLESVFKEAIGRELILRGNLDLEVGLAPALVVNDAVLKNSSWGSRPEMAVIKRLEVRVSLIPLVFRRVEVKRIVLVDPDILIETNPGGESNLGFLEKIGVRITELENLVGKQMNLSINRVDIKDGLITYRNGKTGKKYVVTVKNFDASARNAGSPLKVTLNGSYNGKPFEATGNFVPLAGLADTGRLWPFSLTVTAEESTVSLDGTIKDIPNLRGIDVKIMVKSKDIARIGEFAGVQVPIQGPLELSGRLTDPGSQVYRINEMKLVAGSSDLEGALITDLSKPRPVFTADLRSKRLDLRPFTGKKKASSHARSGGARVFPSSSLPLELLEPADGNLSLKAAVVFSPRLALHNLDLNLALKDGRLSVKPLTAAIGGGSLSGRFDLELHGKTARMETVVTISRLDLGSMLKELDQPDVLDGPTDVRIEVSGTGNSVAGLMSGLDGMTYAIVGKGRISNKYVGLLGSDLSSGILRMINPFNKESSSTAVSCIVCGFRIKKGIAETTALVVNGEHTSVVGKGTVNLRTEELDISLRPVPKEGIGTGITGKFSLSMGELTKPFKLTGTLAHPSLGIDLEQVAIETGKAVGGFMLLGPIGLGGVLVGESSSDAKLCPLAVEAARQGAKLKLVEKKGIVGKTMEGAEKSLGGVGKKLKGLFGK